MTVYLVHGKGHYDGVFKVMRLMSNAILDAIINAKSILLKPNFVSTRVKLSATPVEAVKAILDFVEEVTGNKKVIIAEGPASSPLEDGLRNYGYLKLRKEYNVEFFDLNKDPNFKIIEVYDRQLERTIKIRISKTVLESDFRISLCRPKTHDTVIATLTIKNMIVGSIMGYDKQKIHQGYHAINATLALLATILMPQLAVIDGYIGMEGDGPVNGSPIKLGVALGGINPVEVDAITAWIMGFKPQEIGYLYFLNKLGYGEINPRRIHIVGEDPIIFRKKFKPHRLIEKQITWKNKLAEILEVLKVDIERISG